MPPAYQKLHRHPGKPPYRLCDAAADGMLVTMRCYGCRRTGNFLASDLVKVIDPEREALSVHFPCSKCGPNAWIEVKLRAPEMGDHGLLSIRRPKAIKTVVEWETVKLGDPGGLG